MNDANNVTQPYEAPSIEDRAPLEIPLIGLSSNTQQSAAFRPL